MRVDVIPRHADVLPGVPLGVSVTITNTATVIGGYTVRVLGADPAWVALDAEQISLFPDESRTLTATVTVPLGIPAGVRRIAVQVRELTPPQDSTVAELDLTVPAAPSVALRLDPISVTAGRRASYSVVIENSGNTTVAGRLGGDDPESKVRFDFAPDALRLAPGEHAVVDLRASARRHLTGSPVVRILGLYLDPIPVDPFFADVDPDTPVVRDERTALATGSFIQKPILSRGPISLLGLLAAITVFAIIITIALSRLVGQSAADRDLALQVAQARNASATTGTSGVAGTVRLLTSGDPVRGVSVDVFPAADTTTPLATTATDDKGAYALGNLAAGDYKLSFRGAGFVQLWYPGAATDADAATVTVKVGQQMAGLDVRVGGVPATISGTVVGDDVSAATLTLETAGAVGTTATTASDPAPTPGTSTTPAAVVRTVPIGADGTFTLSDVPSPTVYDLVVSKTAYATSTQRIDIGAGETRTGVEIRLVKGDGLISGHVNSATGPLGGVTITATAGQSTANTVSLTAGDVGAFTLRGLPTPGTFTVVATQPGFTAQTLSLTLAAGQKLTGVAIALGQSSGSLAGIVTTVPGNAPAPGVTVTITDGTTTVQTVTESTGSPGSWLVGGLALPGTYTVTFSRSDLASQTVSVALDSNGNTTPGSAGATLTAAGVTVSMQSATATVFGTVTQPASSAPGATVQPLGEATVSLNSGTTTYTVTSASVPTAGAYRLERIPPGTYTLSVVGSGGTSPASRVIILAAGQTSEQDVALAAPATLSGVVTGSDPLKTPRVGWTVNLYLSTQYPAVVTATAVTDATGAYSFTNINAGAYIVEVRTTPSSTPVVSATAVVKASTDVTVNITADPGG